MLLRSVLAATGCCLVTLSLAFAQDEEGQPPKQPVHAPQGLGIWLIGTHPAEER